MCQQKAPPPLGRAGELGGRCPQSWQQHWQQSHRTALDRLSSRQGPADELRVAEPSNPRNNSDVGTATGCPHTDSASDGVFYDLGSTTLVTTQRCLPILRSRVNPSFS